jgi:dihydrofolate reductase
MKVEIVVALSLDGKISCAKDESSLVWTSKEDTAFFVAKTKEAGAVVMGSATFETIGRPLKDRLLIIMSRTLEGREQLAGQVEWTDQAPAEILKDLEARGYERVVIGGGAQIYTTFLKEGLVTDIYATVEPIVFGEGVSFLNEKLMKRLQFVESRMLNEHATMIHYTVQN